jgi:hypothetical protein
LGNERTEALRTLLAIIAALLVAHVVFFAVGFAAEWLFPTPPEFLDLQTPEETAARVEGAKVGGLALVVLGSALGGVAGGVAGGIVAGRRAVAAAVVTAALLSLWGVYSFYVFYPDRLWFPLGLFIGFPLFTMLGGLAVARQRQKSA